MPTDPKGTSPETPLETPITPASPFSAGWNERVGGFATAVSKTLEEVTNAIVPLVGEPGSDALAVLADPSAITDEDLRSVLVNEGPKIPLGVFRKNLTKLRGAPSMSATPAEGASGGYSNVLPQVPDDTSFLEMLKVGGVLKIGVAEVISAIKAALANKLGLYDLPDKILRAMESFADSQGEPVGAEFFELQKLVTSRSYGEILSAIGVSGSFISDKRRNAFLTRIDDVLWPSLVSFQGQLIAWQEAWSAGMSNPAALLTAMAMSQSGVKGMMPPGMMQPPETNTVRDAAEGVINDINKTFAGVGIPVARALAFDATRMKSVLENDKLPTLVGSANREQMLKQLGVTVSADYVRLERNLAGYTLAVMELPKVTSGQEEYAYLASLIQLGLTIPWDKLGGGTVRNGRAGIGRSAERL